MILARVPFCKRPHNDEKIAMQSGHTCSADRARDRVWRTLRGHDIFFFCWKQKTPPVRAGRSGKKVRALPSLTPQNEDRKQAGEDSFRYWMGRAAPSKIAGRNNCALKRPDSLLAVEKNYARSFKGWTARA